MSNELKATVVNMKSLSQDITDPIIVGAGDADGRSLRIIFTQEAAAQFTPHTKVYLSWLHQEKNIKGYNVFTEIINEDEEDFPPTWEIHYPQSMLWEGNVLACIQLVDEVSITTSTNFMIHILSNPNDGSDYMLSDDFSDFKKMIIRISCLEKQMKDQMESQKIEFEDMQLAFQRIQLIARTAEENAEIARQTSEEALETANAAINKTDNFLSSLGELEDEINDINLRVQENKVTAEEAKDIAEETKILLENYDDKIENAKNEAKQYADNLLTIVEF